MMMRMKVKRLLFAFVDVVDDCDADDDGDDDNDDDDVD